jgi:hypothetical protein
LEEHECAAHPTSQASWKRLKKKGSEMNLCFTKKQENQKENI